MTELKPIKLLTTDTELRRVVEQLNIIVSTINSNQTEIDTDITALQADSFNVNDILVDQYGDVLTDENGEVLLDS